MTLQCPSLLTLSVSTALKITDVAISKVRHYDRLSALAHALGLT